MLTARPVRVLRLADSRTERLHILPPAFIMPICIAHMSVIVAIHQLPEEINAALEL